MKKVRVYLPRELKKKLKLAAAASGKSEAELICEGVSEVVELELAPKPRPLFSSDDRTIAERVDELPDEGLGKD
jgi:plasmid stability protein